ncbi:MAG: aconitase X catalytic domain-containing protein [Actinobacteria bacterium]|nr:aconitase X catalytic domain-containing protein [Actinomycetota bacterium]
MFLIVVGYTMVYGIIVLEPDPVAMEPSAPTVELTPFERDVLEGGRGPVPARVMRTVVSYAEALRAERLVEITGDGHFVITYALPGIAPSMAMLEELVAAGLKTCRPFTLDPLPPLDFENWFLEPEQVEKLGKMYRDQALYMEHMSSLGLQAPDACTCTPYLPQVGNVPRRGDILAWSESACVAFANSVVGARSNRNGAIMDLLCNIVGRVPLSGLLTDEGRKATRRIEVATESLPSPQLLGAAIGRHVIADVPFITGLDRRLEPTGARSTLDYLHEMGAAAATAGAVGLFHVEGITPEAIDDGEGVLLAGYDTYRIDDEVLHELEVGFPVPWGEDGVAPHKCFVGCPHLSLEQLRWWAEAILAGLGERGIGRVRVPTTLAAAPGVLRAFEESTALAGRLREAGVRVSPGCAMQVFDDDLSAGEAIITNSSKLRTYTHARYFRDEEIVRIVVEGNV